ncbi:hypothetical protein LXL04_017081 [Taraxacum kok-saghyz]
MYHFQLQQKMIQLFLKCPAPNRDPPLKIPLSISSFLQRPPSSLDHHQVDRLSSVTIRTLFFPHKIQFHTSEPSILILIITLFVRSTMFVPTKLQVPYIFIESLPRQQFEQFRHMLRLGPPSFPNCYNGRNAEIVKALAVRLEAKTSLLTASKPRYTQGELELELVDPWFWKLELELVTPVPRFLELELELKLKGLKFKDSFAEENGPKISQHDSSSPQINIQAIISSSNHQSEYTSK